MPTGKDYVWAHLDKNTVAAAVAAAADSGAAAAATRSARHESPADSQHCQWPEIAVHSKNDQHCLSNLYACTL